MKKTWKFRALAAVLCLMLLCGETVTAGAVTSLGAESNLVQDLYSYARTEMSFDTAEINSDGQWRRTFKGNLEAIQAAVSSFITTLTSGGWNFTLNHEHQFEYKRYMNYSVTLTYTGTAAIAAGTVQQMFDDAYYGDLMIYYAGEGSTKTGLIVVASGLQVEDLGLRSDGSIVDVESVGPSAGAGLTENADGTFSTTDGRLTATLGQATVLRDGTKYYTSDAVLNRRKNKGREEILIENYYRNEGIAIAFPYNILMTGDSYGPKTLGETTFKDNGGVDKMSDYFTKTYTYLFGICHNGNYLWCHPDPTEEIQDVLVRVLKWDTDQNIGVFYIGCRMKSAPTCVECLAALRLNEAVSYDGDAERVTMQTGDTRTFSFTATEYRPSYETYAWEILEGSALIEMSGVNLQDCRVKAIRDGQARIKVTYTYGDTEPDVLTGIPRHVQKNKSQEFILDIGQGQSEDPTPTPEPTVTPEPEEEKKQVLVKGILYTLEKSTATVSGADVNMTEITIPASIKVNGKTYKVTAIGAGAFKGFKITSLTIGKNISKIGKDAFRKCSKLKTIKINTKKLTASKVGANAFKDISSKAKFTCPSGKAKAYRTILLKKGVSKKATFK